MVELLPVFYAGRNSHRGKPSFLLGREGCRELVNTGLAEWTNKKCASIKLKRREAEMTKTPPSLSLGPRFMQAYAEEKAWARAIFGEFRLAAA